MEFLMEFGKRRKSLPNKNYKIPSETLAGKTGQF